MTDGIIKGTGDSRYLKGAGWPSTYAEFKAMAEAGTLPIDLNGINAAGWQQIGDALNKANLLSDTTAAKLDGVATPNAAFDLLSRFHAGLGNEYVWSKYAQEFSLGSATAGGAVAIASTTTTDFIRYANSAEDLFTGNYQQINVSVSSESAAAAQSAIRGKYCYSSYQSSYSSVVYFDSSSTVYVDGTILRASNGTYYRSAGYYPTSLVGYVNSPSSAAYPPAVSDGYTYTPLGQVGNKVRIATGSYVGTGTYGSESRNSLTFDFAPQCVLIQAETSSQFSTSYTLLWCGQSGDAAYGAFSLLNKTLSWYGNSAANQKNTSGITYKYVAIG